MKRGFSIVELVVVLAVISILAGISIPQYLRTKERVKVQQAMGVANAIRMALSMYATENVPNTKLPLVYPDGTSISNLDDLYAILSPYLGSQQPKNNLGGSSFAVYETGKDPMLNDPEYSAYPEVNRTMYTLTVKAKDKAQTLITITPKSVRAVFDGDLLAQP